MSEIDISTLLERTESARVRFDTEKATYFTRLGWGKAFLHTVLKPAEPSIVLGVSQELAFPPSLLSYFRRCNGAQLFVASRTCRGIHLFGCRERDQPFSRNGADPSPIDIRQTKDLVPSCVIFGSYGFDRSMLMIDRGSESVRCSFGDDPSAIRREWASLDVFLESEIQRMAQLFAADGTCLTPCEELLPPSRSASAGDVSAAALTTGVVSGDVTIPKAYCDLRGTREWRSVPIEVYRCADIPRLQTGYGVAPDGRSLVAGEGNWKAEWTVIGHEELAGDPIFIDVQQSALPVFTAPHGEGVWEPVMIAKSAAVFFRSLDAVQSVRDGRLDPNAAIATLGALNGDTDVDLEFWTVFMEWT